MNPNAPATAAIDARLSDLARVDGLTRTWRWLASRTGINYFRLMRLRAGKQRYQVSEVRVICRVLGLDQTTAFADVVIEADGSSGRPPNSGGRRPRLPRLEVVA